MRAYSLGGALTLLKLHLVSIIDVYDFVELIKRILALSFFFTRTQSHVFYAVVFTLLDLSI